ncbi:Aste57867_12251 [Aphanomyces stellatus]|uniref:Aste57867_12251 protein n=1 Tax=Aphanomyces stellatus TaxID=120398 RepID=A0A485KV17_9STRA|nr:hypothetical protein As57867_012206 [Aphanomyces stellatus]VFT89104.1 Aste57867_12251 [Aphanomyces stellatus]
MKLLCLALVPAVVLAQATALAPCDTSKIATAAVSTFASSDATSCGTQALGGKEINTLFETTITPDATITKLAATPSCNAWYSGLASAFSTFPACQYLGKNIQDFGKMTLTQFMQANNQEILNFDPSRTMPPYPVDLGVVVPSTNSSSGNSSDSAVSSTAVPKTTTAATAPATTVAPKTSSASSIAVALGSVIVATVAALI